MISSLIIAKQPVPKTSNPNKTAIYLPIKDGLMMDFKANL